MEQYYRLDESQNDSPLTHWNATEQTEEDIKWPTIRTAEQSSLINTQFWSYTIL